MIDKLDIQETISLYHEGASTADLDQLIATFLPDGTWEVPAMEILLPGTRRDPRGDVGGAGADRVPGADQRTRHHRRRRRHGLGPLAHPRVRQVPRSAAG